MMLDKFTNLMTDELPKSLPSKCSIDHQIELVIGVAPPTQALYRMERVELLELKIKLGELLQLIIPSKTPFGAPSLFERKTNESLHFCVEYQALKKN